MNAQRRYQSRNARAQSPSVTGSPRAAGFTLVELLVVIVIIGILMGLLLPAVSAVRKTVNTAYLRTECASIATAVEAYKLKYGDYPPDFANRDIVQRHYRRVFPEILDNELTLLFRLCDNVADDLQNDPDNQPAPIYWPCIMDRAECIVWSLGGFSSDPQRPFTGKGGPLSLITGLSPGPFPSHYQYNSARDNALMEFEVTMLSIQGARSDKPMGWTVDDDGNRILNRTESNDEDMLSKDKDKEGIVKFPSVQRKKDVFPVYRYKKNHAPYVYFDSRTYRAFGKAVVAGGKIDMNGFATETDGKFNLVRPAFSDRQSTSNLSSFTEIKKSLRYWEFANPKTFQVLSPGLDGVFGNRYFKGTGTLFYFGTFYWQYPTGKMVIGKPDPGTTPNSVLKSGVSNYDITGVLSNIRETYERDNVGSFTSSSFENDLP